MSQERDSRARRLLCEDLENIQGPEVRQWSEGGSREVKEGSLERSRQSRRKEY